MKTQLYRLLSALSLTIMLLGCSSEIPLVSVGIDDHYYVARMKKLLLRVALDNGKCSWEITAPDGSQTFFADQTELIFVAADEGDYLLKLSVEEEGIPAVYTSIITVTHEEVEYSPWITEVYDYHPAPGQFVNTMPMYEEGDDYRAMLLKVNDSLCGEDGTLITLGAFGGYVTFGFDHTIVNIPGQNDFRIYGNAVYQKSSAGLTGGSAEPGIVMVSIDANGNGFPDDAWYELKGSAHSDLRTEFNYSVTYRRPETSHKIETSGSSITDLNYIPWRSSTGETGYLSKNTFHTQEYFPMWVKDSELTFHGTRLPNNAHDTFGNGSNFFLESFAWGYADNHPNSEAELNGFDIGNAIDMLGNSVTLPGIDFIRVYTALHQQCNWLGETSTEISGSCDLHIITLSR